MDGPELPEEPGVYQEGADGFLFELREDGLWYEAGRMLTFGGMVLDPDDSGVDPAWLVHQGLFPVHRWEPPDYPPER